MFSLYLEKQSSFFSLESLFKQQKRLFFFSTEKQVRHLKKKKEKKKQEFETKDKRQFNVSAFF